MNKVEGKSQYNPIYEFDYPFGLKAPDPLRTSANESYLFRVTSVSGHIMTKEFPASVRNWDLATIEDLFSIEIEK